MPNPLVSDRAVDFLLYEVLDITALCRLPQFAEHSRETFDLFLDATRKLAREVLYPSYRPMDAAPPELVDGRVRVHPLMKQIYPRLVELGILAASRPHEVGGQQLPLTLFALSQVYLGAGNLSALGFLGLTTGAAHLIEAFGDDALKRELMPRLYSGEWTGTMALTEPQAGSSLADVTTSATPRADGSWDIRGTKIFISGGDHDLTENIVHMTLARLDGAPAGTKGISLFAVPRRRLVDQAAGLGPAGALVDNDVATAGAIHKIGWRGLPSLVLNFGERGDCRGWLVGEPHRGLAYMFQMMNEARLLVGASATASASVAYHESLEYARTRPQGRPLGARDATQPQSAIIEHADVRRMLLRQKAIVEGALAVVVSTARYADLAAHAADADERRRCALLLDLLTPVAKSFPAERGFEANALALQIHGGYGYSSEYPVEAWLRDQKLNTIHEGTTGIQSLDLLGRKAVAAGGAALVAFADEVRAVCAAAAAEEADDARALDDAVDAVLALTAELGGAGAAGDVERMLSHSADYLELFSIVTVAWRLLAEANVARRAPADDFYRGKLATAQYWLRTELPRVTQLVQLCRSGEDSYRRMRPEWF